MQSRQDIFRVNIFLSTFSNRRYSASFAADSKSSKESSFTHNHFGFAQQAWMAHNSNNARITFWQLFIMLDQTSLQKIRLFNRLFLRLSCCFQTVCSSISFLQAVTRNGVLEPLYCLYIHRFVYCTTDVSCCRTEDTAT